jgi:ADP-ribose 1''-phosphate phosphatase
MEKFMGTIEYKKMSLFDAPEHSILVHGCNAKGVWGSGIAVPFKEKFPRAFKEYNEYCLAMLEAEPKYGAVGSALLADRDNKYYVGCLITSFDYGRNRDDPHTIIGQTYLALHDFVRGLQFDNRMSDTIYSNKFNSGMFKVDWKYTETVILYFVNRYNLNWVVCDPDL